MIDCLWCQRVEGDSEADAAAKASSAPAAAGAAAGMSVPATAGDKWKGKKARPDALASAAIGWRDLPPTLTLEALLGSCSAMIGMRNRNTLSFPLANAGSMCNLDYP